MATPIFRSPIVRTVVNSIQKLYPIALAEKWDNTGRKKVLLESPRRPNPQRGSKNIVLLTIDLTRKVVDEAIALRSEFIVTYHPIIFRPLKSLTLSDPQQESLLRLVQEGISVYSPHTAVDAAVGGVNDWLASGISGGVQNEESRRNIEAASLLPEGFEECGMGRVVTLKKAAGLGELMGNISTYLGMERLMVAVAPEARNPGFEIRTIGICAGSGGTLLKKLDVDLLLTGELSHHDALYAKEKGTNVITCFHSNSERGFLSAVMKHKLQQVLDSEWEGIDEKEDKIGFEVVVSKADCDPYVIV